MVTRELTGFGGLDCVQLKNERLAIWITTRVGPRILGLALAGGENLLAVLPEAKIPVEGREAYSLRGGHRLWYAPENPLTTYICDDKPVEVVEVENGLEVIQPADQPTGIQKSWRVVLDPNQARITIDHRLTHLGRGEFELAPWAVTMLRPGGVGLLPLRGDLDDPHGLWPNRQLVLWPYTEINSPLLKLSDKAVSVDARLTGGALKIGSPNPAGWIAYSHKGSLFVKYAAYQKGKEYPDRGASSQIYCGPGVIELETLGPLVRLHPGESVEHQETWEIYPEGQWPQEIKGYYQDLKT